MTELFSVLFHHYVLWDISIGAIIVFLAIPIPFALLDFIDGVRLLFNKPLNVDYQPVEDFAILVPIFGNIRYFRNAHFLKPYGKHVIVCTTNHETEEFYRELDKICEKYKFRQHRSEFPMRDYGKPNARNPWKIFRHFLDSLDSIEDEELSRENLLINNSLRIRHKYCMFLDGDTVSSKSLQLVMGEFVAKNYDLASVRVEPAQVLNTIQRLQRIEYQIAMDARKQYPWLTSGACMIAKTNVLQEALSNHSHFFQGGDIEIGKLTRLLGYRVGHMDSMFLTDVPSTFRQWFRQRVAWSSGDFRHAVVNFHVFSWRHPLYFCYVTIVVYGLLPLRLWSTVEQPLIIPSVIFTYWVLLYIFQWRYRSKYFLLFPFYGMIQALVVTPLGILYYLHTVYRHRNVGLIRLRTKKQKDLNLTDAALAE